jgi:predicted nucleic acid-binding protein
MTVRTTASSRRTTSAGETWTGLRRRAGHHIATRFLHGLARAPRIRLIHVEPILEEEALRWLRRHDEREYSFVDATSFAVMRDLGLREALAFDGDFSANGFVELRARERRRTTSAGRP